MLQGGGDVNIWLIAYVIDVGVGIVDVKVNDVIVEEVVCRVLRWITEGTEFHGLCHGCVG